MSLTALLQRNIFTVSSSCCLYRTNKCAWFSSLTDTFLENLVVEEGCKRDIKLFKYFDNQQKILYHVRNGTEHPISSKIYCDLLHNNDIENIISFIEKDIKGECSVPNNKLNCLLVYFTKNGSTNGIKAVQFIVKKYNISYFELQSGYIHYLAEALWINGKVDDSLKLFARAYENFEIRQKVKFMLICLFPLLLSRHGERILCKTIHIVEQLSLEKCDHILLAYLWKELFQSIWFSDQQLANKLLKKNGFLLQVIQWMIPTMGKEFLKTHKIDDFYRLIELTLENEFVQVTGILLRLLFDYYYIHENIERCSAVVKYSSNLDMPLTEDQQRRYVNLLLKSKNSTVAKLNIKKPQNLKYKF